MALSLLLLGSPGGEGDRSGSKCSAHIGKMRWTCAPDLPTILRESQLAAAGCALTAKQALRHQSKVSPFQAVDESDADVATLERIPSGWQLTRHSVRLRIGVKRALGGHEVLLAMPGSVALLCHGDVVWFSVHDTGNGGAGGHYEAARLRVELPISAEHDVYSSGEESEELCDAHCPMHAHSDATQTLPSELTMVDDGLDEAGDFLPPFQRLSQESAEHCSQSSQSSAQLAHPPSSQSSCCSVEEPASVELDSDECYDKDDDAPNAHCPTRAERSVDTQDVLAKGIDGTGAGVDHGAASSSVASTLLPSAMNLQVARAVEDESASSGRWHAWRCDSCNFVSAGLSSMCELCSAERGIFSCAAPLLEDEPEEQSRATVEPLFQTEQSEHERTDVRAGELLRHWPSKHADDDARSSGNWLDHARDDGGVSIDLTGSSESPGATRQVLASSGPLRTGVAAGVGGSGNSEATRQRKKKRRRVEVEVDSVQPPIIPTAVVTSVMPVASAPGKLRSDKQQPTLKGSGNSSTALGRSLVDRAIRPVNGVDSNTQKRKQQRKQPDRRKAASDFKNGLGPLPPVTLNMDETVPAHEVKVGGVDGSEGLVVHWPRDLRPSRPQLQLMRHAVAALSAGRHALLESPTGTGKTLALLSTCLATQWARQIARHAADEPYSQRLIYVSRTHAQLDQVTRELRRLPYRPMMSLLASRERFCLHADVSRADDKAAACADATHVGKMCCTHLDRAEDINYPQAPKHRANYLPGGKLAVYDIEEIVKDNEANHVCPFHATRDLMTGGGDEKKGWSSALILITYTQLINVCVREASGTERVIDDAIIIVDEAHNLDADCRDTASIELSLSMLEGHRYKLLEFKKALQDGVKHRTQAAAAAFFGPSDTTGSGQSATSFKKQGSAGSMDLVSCVKAAESLIEFFHKLEGFMKAFVSCHTLSDKRELPGPPLAQSLEKDVSARPAVTTLRTKLRAMRAGLVELGVESSAVKSSTINDSDNILMRIEFLLDDGGLHYTGFFTAPSPEQQRADAEATTTNVGTAATDGAGGNGGSRSTAGRTTGGRGRGGARGSTGQRVTGTARGSRAGSQVVPTRDGVLHLLCWSAAVAFRPVAKRASSVLLTSGTLHPMHLLQTEFFAPNTWPGAAAPASPPRNLQLISAAGGQVDLSQCSADAIELQEPPERLEFLQFSAPHFEAVSNNLLNLFVSEAPCYSQATHHDAAASAGGSVRLLGDYRSRSDAGYLSALGGCVLRAAGVVPKGLLVYFPSTAVMQACLQNWGLLNLNDGVRGRGGSRGTAGGLSRPGDLGPDFAHGSIAQQLAAAKSLFVEPMRATADEFDAVLSRYKTAASAGRGAVLFGVLRGRASEGLNFSHDHARGVVMIGIAYPPIYDIKVQSKLNRSGATGGGREWYTGQAFKAANQAIGRLIRNTHDYGVLILLDRRYAGDTLRQMLPGWVRKARRQWHARNANELEPGFAAIAAFFAQKQVESQAKLA